MTTAISRDDVVHLAQLSNLQLADDEIAALQTDLGNILNYVTQLGELDTSGVEPTYQVTDLENVGRDDEVREPSATREQLLALAPDQDRHQIKVPKVL
jgi:aspartyl-tRNA(Asn)/glutamyl-tRNA(Gln) amidotransferase subunit C